ncbi:MAG: PKD domain-containing protein [Bacteroidales bacterium]|nr:PKD domain-containing protein [Bacteroidales bacterium]
MKKHITIIILTIISLSVNAKQFSDSVCSCGFQYSISDSLMIFGSDAYEIFTRSYCRDDSVFHKWTVSNGLESDERDPIFVIPASDSVVEICHKLVTKTGILCEHCEMIYHFPNIPPDCIADFGFYRDSTANSNAVAVYGFYDLSSGNNITSWNWTFGDGDSANLQNPLHEYNDSGFFRISLQIGTENGCKAEKTKYLIVRTHDECQLSIGHYLLESDPHKYQFFCNVYDPRLVMSFRPPDTDSAWYDALRYYWDFGDGYTSGESFVSHTYYRSGEYTVALRIEYADGFTCSASMNDYFIGMDNIPRCDYSGTFYRNYKGYGIDVIQTEWDNTLHVQQIIPKIYLPDSARIWYGIKTYGDTLYIGDEVLPSVTVDCIELQHGCEHTGTVKDYTGLDGCGYLIELDNGTRLEPILIDTSFIFRDNQRVKVSYVERYDLASICMAGTIAEITCIEEIGQDTIMPPPYCEQVVLNTSFAFGDGYCSGTASIDILTPCSAWWYYERIQNTTYKILWSTGETAPTVTGLCPGTLYFVNVTNTVTGQTYTSAFSIFMLQNLFPAWTFTKYENTYRFNIPVHAGYHVSWKFDNGVSLNGNSVAYEFNSGGNHQVLLEVKDSEDNLVYSETILLEVPTNILEVNDEGIEVFPNPVTDYLYLRLQVNNSSSGSYKIYNYEGKLIKELPHIQLEKDYYKVNVSSLKEGFYILVFSDNENQKSVRFMKR